MLGASAWLWAAATAFHIARFENQRWVRAIGNGMRGRSKVVGLAATFSGFIAMATSYGLLLLAWLSFGRAAALLLLAITFIVPTVWAVVAGLVRLADQPMVWVTATLVLWPLGIFLVLEFWP